MAVIETKAKSVLRKHKKIDSWFISHYGMNLYRGCMHDCAYCDGRWEGYYVEEDFGKDVVVKVNAIDILHRELDPKRKRKPFKPSFIMIGGGVGDSYQPIDNRYKLSRKALQLICEYDYPVHVLTKSTLVKRDIDILKMINEKKRAIISFSFSSTDDEISAMFEPGVPSPTERLETLSFFKRQGFVCGMFLLPVIPFITDTPELLEQAVRKASETGLDFIIFGGMTLKDGKQKEYFFKRLNKFYPELFVKYRDIYKGNRWGEMTADYSDYIGHRFRTIAKQYSIPLRIPSEFYKDILNENDLVVVILEQIDYLLRIKGASSPYSYAAYSVSKLDQPISTMRDDLKSLQGIGKFTESIILEILETGSSSYYEKLLR